MTEPDDDLVTLLARSLGDARLGGAGGWSSSGAPSVWTTGVLSSGRPPDRSGAVPDLRAAARGWFGPRPVWYKQGS